MRATEADVGWVAALDADCFGDDAWSPARVAEALVGAGRRAWVEGTDGYVVVRDAGDVVDLDRIAVRAGARRRGVAHRLLAAARPESGGMLLEVSVANVAARAFYAREGFTEIDRRRRYYRDGSDALVLSG